MKEQDGELSVNYSGMVPLLLQAIKEQQAEIDEFKKIGAPIGKQTILKNCPNCDFRRLD